MAEVKVNGIARVSITASGSVGVFVGEDRDPYSTTRSPDLNGVRAFTKGPGSLVAAAAPGAQKITLIDNSSARSLRVASTSADLGAPPVALASNDDYIFTITRDVAERRKLIVLTNTDALTEVARIDLNDSDSAAWVAIENTAGVFAYPDGIGQVAVRETAAPFALVGKASGGKTRTADGSWLRFPMQDRPELRGKSEFKYYLYAASNTEPAAHVVELRQLFESGALISNRLRTVGSAELAHLESPIFFGTRPEEALNGGSVTPKGSLKPFVTGVREVRRGVYVVLFGYENTSGVVISQPRREQDITQNRLVGGSPEDQERLPELFFPGRVERAFSVTSEGAPLTWVLHSQCEGGVAEVDYSVQADFATMNAADVGAVVQDPGRELSYRMTDPVEVDTVERERTLDDLLNAGLSLDRQSYLLHTETPNDSIPGQTRWYARYGAARVPSGFMQAHGPQARVSRVFVDGLESESANGSMFILPEGAIGEFPITFQDPAVAQDGERMGWEIGNSADGSVIALSAESYVEDGFDVGRVHLFRSVGEGIAVPTGVVLASSSPDTLQNGLAFSRFTEVNADGTLLFVGSKRGVGIHLYRINSGGATYWKTLSWPEYTAMPAGERAHEARISEDNRLLIMSTGSFGGGSAVPGKVHVLFSDDDWETWEVRQVFNRPDVDGTADGFTTLDTSRNGKVLAIGAWLKDKAYVFRSEDEWQTYSSYTLNPLIFHFNSNRGISMTVSDDGYRVAVGAPKANWDQDGDATDTIDSGIVELYTYDHANDRYVGLFPVDPGLTLPANAQFGAAVRFNSSARLSVIASGIPAAFVFGIHDADVTRISYIDDAFVGGSADTRWLDTEDTLIVANLTEDNPPATEVGAFRLLHFPEAP